MATTNSSPTIEQIKAIETDWTAAINTEYTTVDARYSSINFSNVSLERGSILIPNILHTTTNAPLFTATNKTTLEDIQLPRDALNAIRKKGLIISVVGTEIHHNIYFVMDSLDCVTGCVWTIVPIADVTTAIAAGKASLVTHDDGRKEVLIAE